MTLTRRLAAILAADVVGFSRLMEADEAGTLAALKAHRKDVLEPLVANHHGRVFKVTGDGVLVEFASAVNAVQCAVDLQQAFATANAELSGERQIVLRIGVNLGDVMVEGGDLYGDGVNIAARLESLADPGGILVSGTAFDHIKSKIKAGFDDLGTQTLKNITEPVRVYRVADTPAVTAAAPKSTTDKPSIAVLPFTNMSGDPEQEYFSDGITEDIITELSRFRSLFVIARNSSFQYKGKNVDVRRIARELGVRYVVEGSVRKMADRVRITAQLIDTATSTHLWSERYDRSLNDIFSVQDEVLHSIVSRLEHRLHTSIAEQARRKPTELLAAYDCVLQARNQLDIYNAVEAEPLLRRAIGLDPSYAQAHALLAASRYIMYLFDPTPKLIDEALTHARNAVALDPNDALCHWVLGDVHMFKREYDEASASFERALILNPGDAIGIANHANLLSLMGRHEEAIARFDLVLQRDPFPVNWFWEVRAGPLYALKHYEEAIQSTKKMDRLFYWNYARLAACYALLERSDEAEAAAREVLRLNPQFTALKMMLIDPYKNATDREHYMLGMRKAGLPE